MRAATIAPLLLLVAGVLLVADAVRRGAATLSLVVIVPVVSGSSSEFVLGVVALIAGIFLLPWLAWREQGAPDPGPGPADPGESPNPGATGGTGGLILVGPVPIFFGSWRRGSRRTRLWLALVGGVAFALLVVALVAVALR